VWDPLSLDPDHTVYALSLHPARVDRKRVRTMSVLDHTHRVSLWIRHRGSLEPETTVSVCVGSTLSDPDHSEYALSLDPESLDRDGVRTVSVLAPERVLPWIQREWIQRVWIERECIL